MTIDKQSLFEQVRDMWPQKTSTENQAGDVSLAQLLNNIYEEIEASIAEDDHWMQIATWAFHQSASNVSKGNNASFDREDVEFLMFDKMMIQNLNGDDCWEDEREIYTSSN